MLMNHWNFELSPQNVQCTQTDAKTLFIHFINFSAVIANYYIPEATRKWECERERWTETRPASIYDIDDMMQSLWHVLDVMSTVQQPIVVHISPKMIYTHNLHINDARIRNLSFDMLIIGFGAD